MAVNVSVDSVSPSQVGAARALLERTTNPELITERIIAVANLPLDDVKAAWAKRPVNDPEKVQAAQLLIELSGGEDKVEPWVVEVAHMTPAEPSRT